jgi:putrescine transport system ATP-binding protein
MASAHAESRSPTIVTTRARRNFAPWADATARPLVRFENVSKHFGGVTAVDHLSLDIYQGEFFALLGPSGCGKSTLLRLLAGFETPEEGHVLLDGVDVTRVPPHRRPVNMMFQSYALFPHLTVEGNVAFGLKQDGLPKAEIASRVTDMLALVKLEGYGAQARPAFRWPAPACRAWRGRSPNGRACSCSTSRSPLSTRSCAARRNSSLCISSRSLGSLS